MGCHFPKNHPGTSLPHAPMEYKTDMTPSTAAYHNQVGATSQIESSVVHPVSTYYQGNSINNNENADNQYRKSEQFEIKSVDARPPKYSPTPFQSVANLQYQPTIPKHSTLPQPTQITLFSVPCGPSTQDFYLTANRKF